MGYKHLTPEETGAILKAYQSGASCADIAGQTGKCRATIYRIVKDRGRNAACQGCGHLLPSGAKYCDQCGKRVLTPGQAVAESLNALKNLTPVLPEGQRDRLIRTINQAVAYLEKEETHDN